MGKPWRVLVAGGGSIGRRHLHNLLGLGQREIRVVDPDPRALSQVRADLGISGWDALDAGLDWEPEAVIVANPTAFHLATAWAAAQRGCHLLIEKPLGDRLEGADALANLVKAKGLVALVACNMRFHPGPRLVQQTLVSGELGTILGARFEVGSYLPAWRPGTDFRSSYSAQPELGGGCLFDHIHELDLACWMCGFPREVFAMSQDGGSLGIASEALADVLLRYDSGLVVSLHLDYVQRWRQRRCEMIGQRGTVAWESRRAEVSVLHEGRTQPIRLGYEADEDPNHMYVEELRHFLRCLEGIETPCADLPWAMGVTRVALAAKESARMHQARELDWAGAVSASRGR